MIATQYARKALPAMCKGSGVGCEPYRDRWHVHTKSWPAWPLSVHRGDWVVTLANADLFVVKQRSYWWVSIGGEECEPGVLKDGSLFTLGCPDAHDPQVVDLVALIDRIPDTPAEAERKRQAWEAKLEKDRRAGITHGYRRF